jgi:hypothetical protein
MISVDQIRQSLRIVIAKKMSLDAFDEWLSAASWNMHKDSSAEAIKLVGSIELMLACFDEGKQPEEELLLALRGIPGVFGDTPDVITSASSGNSSINSFEWSAPSDRRPASVFSYTPLLPA